MWPKAAWMHESRVFKKKSLGHDSLTYRAKQFCARCHWVESSLLLPSSTTSNKLCVCVCVCMYYHMYVWCVSVRIVNVFFFHWNTKDWKHFPPQFVNGKACPHCLSCSAVRLENAPNPVKLAEMFWNCVAKLLFPVNLSFIIVLSKYVNHAFSNEYLWEPQCIFNPLFTYNFQFPISPQTLVSISANIFSKWLVRCIIKTLLNVQWYENV